MTGVTFATGPLIAFERRSQGVQVLVRRLRETGLRITVPSAVVAEWWRGRTDVREELLRGVRVEPLSEATARLAGEAMASVPGATVVDAIVMASAASRDDVVYTSDPGDLVRLGAFFPNVRVFGVV